MSKINFRSWRYTVGLGALLMCCGLDECFTSASK